MEVTRWRRPVPYWIAKPSAVASGYPLKTANLSSVPLDQLADRCAALEAEMLEWLAGVTRRQSFDGTLGALLKLYQTHEHSPYRNLKPSSYKSYDPYLGRLARAYGDIRLDRLTGLEIKQWHKVWRGPDNHLGAANMALAVLKAAVSFGMMSGIPDCDRLRGSMSVLRLPKPAPRIAPTAERAAAHAMGRHRAAFAFALQFETTARQWDVVGQWVRMDDPRPSALTLGSHKWIGPTWATIDGNLVSSA